jgi:lipoate-protein ligase B
MWPGERSLDVRDWGRREYADALSAMRSLRRARRQGEIPDTLLLVEHPPVITVGVQGDGGEAYPPGIPVYHVERGGKGTYHGPGQLVGYPIVDLEPRGRDVRRFVTDLEELLVRALRPMGLRAGRVSGRRGVWIEEARKIASIGVAIEEWVTFHGFALNVDVDLGVFRAFHPCGFSGDVMTSVARELHRSVDVAEVRAAVVRSWTEVFGSPLALAPAPVPAAAPSPSPASASDAPG